ncbi:MAG: hypothetical protein PUC39_01325 [Lachnospiraceae bacterium]|nr:hypothetical protein [Lachnospiraceae bacterium]
MQTYVIYCDESIVKGKYYSNFYGGALVNSKDFDDVVSILESKKKELNLFNEIKWTKVTEQYLDKYIDFITTYFELIKQGKIKIRIMFRKNENEANNLSEYQELNGFYLLYYQFLKHAFGLKYCNLSNENVQLKTYFDKLPNTKEQNERFKQHIYELQNCADFKSAKIVISKEDITDVDSKRHVILQGMDIILGSMQFKLNKENLVKNPSTGRRGKKTIAKEKLYKHISRNIQDLYPHFNIGITTGVNNDYSNDWKHPYRHWSFVPSSYDGERYLF